MKKKLFSIVTFLVLFLMSSGFAFGNTMILGAENGYILAPAGLGLEVDGAFQSSQNPSPLYDAEIGYGITPAITIAGIFKGDFKDGYHGQKMLKALLSPNRQGSGYTVYGNFDLDESKVSCYGISLWKDSRFFYAYGNLESRSATSNQSSGLAVTPGINLKLGSKFCLAGEVEYNPANWDSQQLRIGANYRLSRKMAAKFIYQTGLANEPERTFLTGLTVEL